MKRQHVAEAHPSYWSLHQDRLPVLLPKPCMCEELNLDQQEGQTTGDGINS